MRTHGIARDRPRKKGPIASRLGGPCENGPKRKVAVGVSIACVRESMRPRSHAPKPSSSWLDYRRPSARRREAEGDEETLEWPCGRSCPLTQVQPVLTPDAQGHRSPIGSSSLT